MQKTRIEWCDYSINPVKGLCPVACEYCYARRMYKRFKWNPELRFEPILASQLPPKPSKIFVGSTMELFGNRIDAFWLDSIFKSVKDNPQHTFIFLTKRPERLLRWSPFPENCWVGMTVTKDGIGQDSTSSIPCFEDIEAKVKFVSFEPLLEQIQFGYYTDFVDWVIIGQQTPVKKATIPKKTWIDEIVSAADWAGIPIFEKNNLASLLKRPLRQEFPRND